MRTVIGKALLLCSTLLTLAAATHFRYGLIYYDQINPSTTGTDFWFQMQQAWRWTFFGSPAVNSNISIIGLYYDGTNFINNRWTVNAVNPPNDWFIATWIPTRATVALPTGVTTRSYTAYTTSCCRISTLLNNRDGTWSLKALVYVNKNGNFQSMRSSLIPITTVRVNKQASFALNVLKYNNEINTFRFCTASEAANGASWVLPNPTPVMGWDTGVITWTPTATGLYNVAAIVFGHTGQPSSSSDFSKLQSWFGLDWIIQVINPDAKVCKRFCSNLGSACQNDAACNDCKDNRSPARNPFCDTNSPPYISRVSDPAGTNFTLVGSSSSILVRDGSNTISVPAVYKSQLVVNLTFIDDDVEDYIFVGTGGIPSGSTLSTQNNLNVEGRNAVQFMWTPGDSDLGGALVCFTATDSLGNNLLGQVCLLITVGQGSLSATIPNNCTAGVYTTFPIQNSLNRTHSLSLAGTSNTVTGTVINLGTTGYNGVQVANYQGQFTITKTGTYVASVADTTSTIALKPQNAVGVLVCYPNVVHVPWTILYEQGSTGLTGGTVSSTLSFYLRAFDFWNNTQSLQRTDSFYFSIIYNSTSGQQTTNYTMRWNPVTSGGVTDFRYNGSYVVPALGYSNQTFQLVVYYKNSSSGPEVVVTSRTITLVTNRFTCVLDQNEFVAGKAVDFTFHSDDIASIPVAQATSFTGTMNGIVGTITPVANSKSWRFVAASGPTKAQTYSGNLGANSDGTSGIVLSSPGSGTVLFDFTVINDIPSAAYSSVSAFDTETYQLEELEAQEDSIVIIAFLQDQYGNPCTVGDFSVAFSVTSGTPRSAAGSQSGQKQIFYFNWSPNTAGQFTISTTVTVNAIPQVVVPLSDKNGEVVPGKFSPIVSSYSPQSSVLRDTIAGSTKSYTNFAKDYLGNKRDRDGDVFNITFTRAATSLKPSVVFNTIVSVPDPSNKDQYVVDYAFNTTGTFSVGMSYSIQDGFAHWTTLSLTVWAGAIYGANITVANADNVKKNTRAEIAIQTVDSYGNVIEDRTGGRYLDGDNIVQVYNNFTQAYIVQIMSANGMKSTWYYAGYCSKSIKKPSNCPTSFLQNADDENNDKNNDKGLTYENGVKRKNLSDIDGTLYQDGFFRVFYNVPSRVFNYNNYTVKIYLVNTQVVNNNSTYEKIVQDPSTILVKTLVFQIAKSDDATDNAVSFNYFVVFGAAAGCFFVSGVGYGAFRLGRYRPKYKQEKARADENEQILDEMRDEGNLAGGRDYMAVGSAMVTMNPLHEAYKSDAVMRQSFAQERNPALEIRGPSMKGGMGEE